MISLRRVAPLLLGAWMGGSGFMTAVAIGNFQVVDQLLAAPQPGAAAMIDKLGPQPARTFWRYLASEMNRTYFQGWERVQLFLGLGAAGSLYLARRSGWQGWFAVGAALLMASLVAAQHWLLTPGIVGLGRLMDFAPAGELAAQRTQFWRYHGFYSAVEVFKLVLGVGLCLYTLSVSHHLEHRQRRPVALDDLEQPLQRSPR